MVILADDKKIKAIYMMLEDEIAEEKEWWNNAAFVAELEKEYAAWESGKDKGYSFVDIKAEIASWKAQKHDRWTGLGDRFVREVEKISLYL